MAVKSNPITLFLYNNRNITLSLWAKKYGLSPTSTRNTFYGIRPIRKVVMLIKNQDKELFELLPQSSKDLIKDIS